jgi:hypothetical protein
LIRQPRAGLACCAVAELRVLLILVPRPRKQNLIVIVERIGVGHVAMEPQPPHAAYLQSLPWALQELPFATRYGPQCPFGENRLQDCERNTARRLRDNRHGIPPAAFIAHELEQVLPRVRHPDAGHARRGSIGILHPTGIGHESQVMTNAIVTVLAKSVVRHINSQRVDWALGPTTLDFKEQMTNKMNVEFHNGTSMCMQLTILNAWQRRPSSGDGSRRAAGRR